MSKPEGIPQDIWNTASSEAMAYVDWIGRGGLDSDAEHVLSVSISNAIMAAKVAEMEECAKVALSCPDSHWGPWVARAIRSRS